ncbi:putative RNA-directed DNA polymerase from transposon BS [Araneus ventricosus]|uniref:Putative RNA-directed DNA polymerase from transposon BS n=1 Tax=Araneus ventricosus TaxID=182803 RepID=A0A4Y2CM53_ARAVE|nr:putative RNA-directed DNA polymerase from transposon BS [Araneus ventricosus]
MIVNLSNAAKQRLLFNQSWLYGKLPMDWKRDIVVPILKPGRGADISENYRPISLTCIPCKIMERIILNRLNFHLTEKNLFPREQYGFRKGHGTIDQILYFCQYVRDAQNKKPTNHTITVLLDLTKAFDKVWCNKLISKLFEEFAISGRALPWISDFLSRRQFK